MIDGEDIRLVLAQRVVDHPGAPLVVTAEEATALACTIRPIPSGDLYFLGIKLLIGLPMPRLSR